MGPPPPPPRTRLAPAAAGHEALFEPLVRLLAPAELPWDSAETRTRTGQTLPVSAMGAGPRRLGAGTARRPIPVGRGQAVRPCKLWGPAPPKHGAVIHYLEPSVAGGGEPCMPKGVLHAGAAAAADRSGTGAGGGSGRGCLPRPIPSPLAPLKLAGSFPAPLGPDPAPSRRGRGGCFPAGFLGRRVLPGDAGCSPQGWAASCPRSLHRPSPMGCGGPAAPSPAPSPTTL